MTEKNYRATWQRAESTITLDFKALDRLDAEAVASSNADDFNLDAPTSLVEVLPQLKTYVFEVDNSSIQYEWVEGTETYTVEAYSLEEALLPDKVYPLESVFEQMWDDIERRPDEKHTPDNLPVVFTVRVYERTSEAVSEDELNKVLQAKLDEHREFVVETLAHDAKIEAEKQKDVEKLKKEMKRLGLTARDLGMDI